MAENAVTGNENKELPVKMSFLNQVLKYRKLVLFGIAVLFLVLTGVIIWKVFLEKNNQKEKIEKIEGAIPGITDNQFPVISLGEFVVNLNDYSEKHYLKIGISIELESKELEPEVKSHEAQLKDIIIGIISSRDSVNILTAQEKEKIKREILVALNYNLKKGKITSVYFTDFIVQ